MIKIGIIIPNRGDRPEFMKNCLKQIESQTIRPYLIEVVDFLPESEAIDITKRYRIGYDQLRNKGLDLIAFMENDDAYAENYLEYMVKCWQESNTPDILGTTYTHYYHIKLQHYFTMYHYDRSSMMNTFIKPDLNFNWCADWVAYTDMHLWDNCKQLSGALITPEPVISLGIKHGVGLCGGAAHQNKLDLYYGPRGHKDIKAELLKSICIPETFNFYNNFYEPTYEKRICG